MFIGQYIIDLDSKGRFIVPEHFRAMLARNAEEDKALFFAAAERLRVYSQLGVRDYVAQMEPHLTGDNGKIAAHLLGATLSGGLAFHSASGRVAIPERFMRMYELSPGMRLTLLGCGEFFEAARSREEGEDYGHIIRAMGFYGQNR